MDRQNSKKTINDLTKKEMVKIVGERYISWYYKNLADFKKFWLHEFVYPIVFPVLSMAILRYPLKFSFTKEEGIVLFMLFYTTTILGRILSKYQKLVSVLDPLIDEVKELKKDGEIKKTPYKRNKT